MAIGSFVSLTGSLGGGFYVILAPRSESKLRLRIHLIYFALCSTPPGCTSLRSTSALLGDVKSVRDFSTAIDLNPNYAKAYNDRGLAYSSKGEYQRAIRDLQKALRLAWASGQRKLAMDIQNRLQLYKLQRP